MFNRLQLLFVVSVCLLSAMPKNVVGQQKTRVGKMLESGIFSGSTIPNQKEALINKFASQPYLVYRNPGPALATPSQFRTADLASLFGTANIASHSGTDLNCLAPEVYMRRDVNLVESIWNFCWNQDGKGEENILLGVEPIPYNTLLYSPTPHTLSGMNAFLDMRGHSEDPIFKETFGDHGGPYFIQWLFSLHKMSSKKLTEEFTITTWTGKKMSFPSGTEYLHIETEDVEVQAIAPILSEDCPHTWTLDLFPLKDGGWVGTLKDEYIGKLRHEGENPASFIVKDLKMFSGGYSSFFNATNTTDSEFGFNRTHVVYLAPVPWKDLKDNTPWGEKNKPVEIPTPK